MLCVLIQQICPQGRHVQGKSLDCTDPAAMHRESTPVLHLRVCAPAGWEVVDRKEMKADQMGNKKYRTKGSFEGDGSENHLNICRGWGVTRLW